MALITFDGTSYVYTSDINLLDGDRAHVFQGIGGWQNNSRTTVTSTPQTPPTAPPYGTTALKCTVSSTDANSSVNSGSLDDIALSGSTQYTFSCYVYASTANREAYVRISDYDSSDVLGGTSYGTATALAVGEWTQLTVTHTTESDAAKGRLFLIYDDDASGNVTTGEIWWMATMCLRTGSDGTFVPTLRIVNDEVDLRAFFVADAWTGSAREIVSRRGSTPFEYSLRLDSAGKPELYWHDGAAYVQPGVGTNPLSGTDLLLVRAVRTLNGANYDVDYTTDGAGNGTQSVAKSGNVPDTGETNLAVGGRASGGSGVAGQYEYVEVRDGDGGPVVARADVYDAISSLGYGGISNAATWTDSVTGRTWTVSGTTLTIAAPKGSTIAAPGQVLVTG